MKIEILGDTNILQKPHTRFYIYFMDLNRIQEVLQNHDIPYFAMEMNRHQMNWVLHISDEKREKFDELVVRHDFNLAPMSIYTEIKTKKKS